MRIFTHLLTKPRKPGLVDFEEMKHRLGQVWSNFQPDNEFKTGDKILEELFQ